MARVTLEEVLVALGSGAAGGAATSYALAKVIADRAEAGRRRHSERMDLAVRASELRARAQAAAGSVRSGHGVSGLSEHHLEEFARKSAVASFHLGWRQRRGLQRQTRALVGAFVARQGEDLAHVGMMERAGSMTLSWGAHRILSARTRRDKADLAHKGALQQALTTHELKHFDEAERILGRILTLLRKSW